MCVSVCKCDECSLFNYCINMDFESVNKDLLLYLCFTLFLSHGHLPQKLIQTTIVPIIKNKCGNISSSHNYRPIALATVISKLLESILLMKCEEYLCTSANQSNYCICNIFRCNKAFERLDHLIVWYLLQRMHIRWGNTISTSFRVSNSVKQGGIMSPVLFNVYMNDLSCALNRSNIGGRIGGEIVNHLSYADDFL